MSEKGGNRIRIVLRWVQIKDNKEAMWDDEGEFRFRAKVTTAGQTHEVELPKEGYWSISDHPRRNKVDKIDKVLFEGEAGDNLVLEVFGTELDQLTPNDELETYRMEFKGDVAGWLGRHEPTDEGSDDPENLTDWRLAYDVERA